MPEMRGGRTETERMDEMDLRLMEHLFSMFTAEGGEVLACPLTVPLFRVSERDRIDGARLADPVQYCKDVVIPVDMNLTLRRTLFSHHEMCQQEPQ